MKLLIIVLLAVTAVSLPWCEVVDFNTKAGTTCACPNKQSVCIKQCRNSKAKLSKFESKNGVGHCSCRESEDNPPLGECSTSNFAPASAPSTLLVTVLLALIGFLSL